MPGATCADSCPTCRVNGKDRSTRCQCGHSSEKGILVAYVALWGIAMSSESPLILTVPQGKRIMLRACAIVLSALGTLPSIWVSFLLGSVLPFLGGLFLGFLAYCLAKASNLVLEIGPEGISLGDKRRRQLTKWSEVVAFSQGCGIDRHKVAITLASGPAPRQINLGLFRIECRKVCHLPGTFRMKAGELADLLNQTRDRCFRDARQREDVDRKP
jgi:hypothetical protein